MAYENFDSRTGAEQPSNAYASYDNYARELCNRYEKLRNEAAEHFQHCEDMAPFIAPSRMGIVTPINPGQKLTGKLYDSTTLMAAELMSQFVAGHVINPSQRWVGFQLEDPYVRTLDPVKEWMEECRDRFLEKVSASAFYAEGPEGLLDYVGFGTACLFVEENPVPSNIKTSGFRGFHFRAERTGRFIIQEGPNGRVDTVFRELQMTCRVAYDFFQLEYALRVPEKLATAWRDKQWDKPFTFIHAVCPRPLARQTTVGPLGMPWASCWMEKESKEMVKESGYRLFPAAIPRYSKTPGEIFGRGRGHIAFPDTWSLNAAKRMSLEDFALKIRPPVLHTHNSAIGTLRLTPGAPTSVNTHGKPLRDVIMPYESGSRPEINNISEENLRKSIRDIFYVDAILQLLEVHKSEQTAFEYARKLELLFRLLGPVYGRVEWEWLYSVADIGFMTMLEAGAFSDPPPEAFMSDGKIAISFDNPIARAQKSGDSEALLMAINDLAPLVQAGREEILDWIETDETTLGVLQTRGVPAKWVASEKVVAKIREERAKTQQQQLQQQQAMELAKAAKDAAPVMQMMQGGGGA